MLKVFATVTGTSDPAEAPLIELDPAPKPYLVRIGAVYVKILVSAPAESNRLPDDERVGAEGDYAVIPDLLVGSDESTP